MWGYGTIRDKIKGNKVMDIWRNETVQSMHTDKIMFSILNNPPELHVQYMILV